MDDYLAGIKVEFIPLAERSHPLDRWRVCQDGGTCWLATDGELHGLVDAILTELDDRADVG